MARKIVIEVSGGNIQGIFSTPDAEDCEIYVIDWDNIEAGQLEAIEEYPFIKILTNVEITDLINNANLEIEKNSERI